MMSSQNLAAPVRHLLALPFLALLGVLACDGGPSGPPSGETLTLELENVAVPGGMQAGFEVVVVGPDGERAPAGEIAPSGSGGRFELENPLPAVEKVVVALSPETGPGKGELVPMLGGELGPDGRAELDLRGQVTAGDSVALEAEPGTHVLFTPSDNRDHGYPSYEDAGIWVFNIKARDKPARESCRQEVRHSDFFLDMAPLANGWTYEGWVVRDHGTDDAVWLSYGKFQPDPFGKLNKQDNTGLGPFSGWQEFVDAPFAKEHCFPGDDWVKNPLGLELPAGLEVPLDLNGNAEQGVESRWTNVITVEPAFQARAESPEQDPAAPLSASPFPIRPYRNPIGEAGADEPRTIEFHPEKLPRGTVILR